ncbi:MAG: hypothetical protein ABIO94_13815 [Opitutaceae bacterium]
MTNQFEDTPSSLLSCIKYARIYRPSASARGPSFGGDLFDPVSWDATYAAT